MKRLELRGGQSCGLPRDIMVLSQRDDPVLASREDASALPGTFSKRAWSFSSRALNGTLRRELMALIFACVGLTTGVVRRARLPQNLL